MATINNIKEIIKLYASGVRDFSDSQYDEVNLDEGDLRDVNLSNSNLSYASMVRANLSGANLSHTNLSDAELDSACLNKADLSQAVLESANLASANLSEANLRNANLSYSNLKAADLGKADLRGADLEDVKYDETTRFPEDFNPSSYKGIWLSENTFIKYEWIDCIEIAKNWDRFSDAMAGMGLGEEVVKILGSTYGDHYSYRSDIWSNDIEIRVSDLADLDWDYLKIEGKKFLGDTQQNISLSAMEDAIQCGEVDLILFLYT